MSARPAAPRLLVDCGHTIAGAQYSGIQRYVRHTLRQAAHLLGTDRVGAIGAAADGSWRELAAMPAHPMEGLGPLRLHTTGTRAVHFDANSHVLLADRLWHLGRHDALDQLLRSPARITLVVYDLLSLSSAQWFAPGVGERFGRYLRDVLPRAQQIVCLSHAVRHDLHDWAAAQGLRIAGIDVVAPGHRVWEGTPETPAALPAGWRGGSHPFVLQVGTIEPRKNHAQTLAALRRHWDSGSRMGLLFIGQRGWLMEPFMDAMAQLPQWQRELIWLSECTDAQLDWCYRHAAAVFYPSANEGYGLPLAEAASVGTPVIASDTAVHREVVRQLAGRGEAVRLCEPSAENLDALLAQALTRPAAPRGTGGRGWREATADLLNAMKLPAQHGLNSRLLQFR
ncbi:MAG: glycosyltransferase family 1 protein [Ramlibacter sp.]